MASHIWAIDANGGGAAWVEWLKTAALSAPFSALETVWITSIPDMVNKILGAAGSNKIERLALLGHAHSGMQGAGCGASINLTSKTMDFFALGSTGQLMNGAENEISRLVPSLDPAARVTMGGCQVANPPNGEPLLKRISTVLRVTVEGGIWNQSPLFPGFEGPVVRCNATICSTMRGPFKEFR